MSVILFDENLTQLTEEWNAEGIKPSYGSVRNDILVQKWDEFMDPVNEFTIEGVYEEFKEIVSSYKLSGTFYRDYDESTSLKIHNTFKLPITSWKKDILQEEEDIITMKLTCTDVPGIDLRDSAILGECELKVISRTRNLIEVEIVN